MKTAIVCILPDKPKVSSARGLADEEECLQKSMWNLRQHCDNRFVLLFNPPATSDKKSAVRRFSMGRFVVSTTDVDTNEWLSNSELCLAGRPLMSEAIELPKQKDLLLPESTDPDKDLRLAERQRPSLDQVLAQKGVAVAKSVLNSAMANMPFTPKSVVLVVSLTGYVEDIGCAVMDYKMQDHISGT